jgi:hypothetical protein
MTREFEEYYMKFPEPTQGCLLALRNIILNADNRITPAIKYQIPFFYFRDKKLCFLWVNKKKLILGFITDKTVFPVMGGVKRKDEMKMIQIDPAADISIEMILENLNRLINLYDSK